jgi:hypothetical protein
MVGWTDDRARAYFVGKKWEASVIEWQKKNFEKDLNLCNPTNQRAISSSSP